MKRQKTLLIVGGIALLIWAHRRKNKEVRQEEEQIGEALIKDGLE